MNDSAPLFLHEAVISLYPAELYAPGALTGMAVWSGAWANR